MKKYQYITYYIKYLQYLVKLAIWKVRHGRHPSPPTTYLPLHQRKKFLAATFFLIFIAPVIVYLGLKAAKTAEAAWFDESYSYRQPFSFTHNADINDQRAITFSLDTAELITDGVMQSDCDDTRFTDINGKVLKYELTGACNNAATTYEVIFESIINGSNVGYVYYGNPSAVSASIDSSGYTALTPSGGDPSITSRTNEEQSPGPAAYWKFDEGYGATANDSTSNANNGTITSATWQAEDMCLSGKCLQFDGSDDYVEVTDNNTLSPSSIALSAWIRYSDDGSTYHGIISKYSTTTPDWLLRIKDNLANFNHKGGESHISGTTLLNDNKWHYIVGVYNADNDTRYVYVDGQLENSDSNSVDIVNTDNNVLIGMDYTSDSGRGMNGFIDEVKIYPYARTAAQIKSDYASRGSVKGSSASFGSQDPFASLSQGLIGYWKMDESAANSCGTDDSCDSSGNDHDGAWGANATFTDGKFGNGVTFDGADDVVTIAETTPLQMLGNNITLSVWAKPADTTASKIVGKGQETQRKGYQITYSSGIHFLYSDTTASGDHFITGPTYTAGEWIHLTMTINKDTGILTGYVDGEPVGTLDVSAVDEDNNAGQSLKFGEDAAWDYNGVLDEVRLYNRALSPREVRTLYNWAPGPKLHYKFDEGFGSSVQDISGNGYTGSWGGSGTTRYSIGKYGKAGQFNGSDDRVSTSLTWTPVTFTVEWWVYPKTCTNWNQQISGGTWGTFAFHTATNCVAYVGTDLTNRFAPGELPANTLTLNQWQHFSYTYDGTQGRFYKNGVLIAGPKNQDNPATWSYFRIGASSAYSIDGLIDDVRIYNYARTPGQIIQDMNGGHPLGGSPISSQLILYKFDEGYGTIANNSGFGGSTLEGVFGASAAAPSWINTGKSGKALNFTAVNNTVVRTPITTSNGLNIRGAITYSTWFKRNSTTGNQTLIDMIDSCTVVESDGYFLRFSDETLTFYGYINDAAGSNPFTLSYSNSSLTGDTSNWHHVVATWNGTTNTNGVKMFIDGKLVAQTTASADATNMATLDGSNLSIGTLMCNTHSFDGYIDEVKIYNSALTADEILIDMNQSSSVVMGAIGTDSSGNASFSSDRSYCPPGDTTASCGPVAEWKLDEKTSTNAYDTSGNGKTGTLTNSPSWSTGKIGSALTFNGSSNYVNLPSLTTTTAPYTVEFWMYPTSLPGVQTMVSLKGSNTFPKFNLHTNDRLLAYAGAEKYKYGTKVFASGDLNKWWHVAFVVADSSSLTDWKVYVNGQDDTGISGANTGTYYDPGTSGAIGNNVSNNYFNGKIDDVKIYNYARTPAQIAWDYNRGKPVGHWKLDTCQGTTAYDSSGNANHGTITAGDTSGSNDSVGTCNSGAGDEMWDNGTTGKRNYSLDFDGTNDYVGMNDTKMPTGSDDRTISFWMKAITYASNESMFTYGTETTSQRFEIGTRSDGNLIIAVSGGAYGTTDLPTAGSWIHVSVVFSGSNVGDSVMYINGSSKTLSLQAGSNVSVNTTSNGSAQIGTDIARTGSFFDGQIDDVKIFNYALTNQQIKTLYNSGALFFGPTTGSP